MCENNTLHVADLGLDTSERQLLPSVEQIDLDYLLKAIEDNKHNMSAAARHLGISRTTLYRLIKNITYPSDPVELRALINCNVTLCNR